MCWNALAYLWVYLKDMSEDLSFCWWFAEICWFIFISVVTIHLILLKRSCLVQDNLKKYTSHITIFIANKINSQFGLVLLTDLNVFMSYLPMIFFQWHLGLIWLSSAGSMNTWMTWFPKHNNVVGRGQLISYIWTITNPNADLQYGHPSGLLI